MNNTTQPWARSAPADPDAALREIGKTLTEKTTSKLRQFLEADARLSELFKQRASPAALEQSRDREAAVFRDESLAPELAAEKVRTEREFRSMAEDISRKIDLDRSNLWREISPICAIICDQLIGAIESELDSLPKVAVFADRWRLGAVTPALDAFKHPLMRLSDIVRSDHKEYQSGSISAGSFHIQPDSLIRRVLGQAP